MKTAHPQGFPPSLSGRGGPPEHCLQGNTTFGITSTIPLEIPLAAGKKVLDLNNIFITHPRAPDLVKAAEGEGFPRNCCSWIRGLYGLVRERKIERVIFVTGGDCSNTHAMMETLQPFLQETATFSFPFERNRTELGREMERFAGFFGISLDSAEEMGRKLASTRNLLCQADRMTWEGQLLSGSENLQWLVSASDFQGDPASFHGNLSDFLGRARKRSPINPDGVRIGILGVPPILTDVAEVLEGFGAKVVWNEMPLQFSLPFPDEDLTGRYLRFSYPYGVGARIEDIRQRIRERSIRGLVHYTQAFCHRQIHDIVIRREIDIPILTIEGETPGVCDQRTRLRLESFVEILKES